MLPLLPLLPLAAVAVVAAELAVCRLRAAVVPSLARARRTQRLLARIDCATTAPAAALIAPARARTPPNSPAGADRCAVRCGATQRAVARGLSWRACGCARRALVPMQFGPKSICWPRTCLHLFGAAAVAVAAASAHSAGQWASACVCVRVYVCVCALVAVGEAIISLARASAKAHRLRFQVLLVICYCDLARRAHCFRARVAKSLGARPDLQARRAQPIRSYGHCVRILSADARRPPQTSRRQTLLALFRAR